MTSNSAPVGTGRPTRITPFVSSMPYAARRASGVETSASGEFEPSFGRKIGSVPSVAAEGGGGGVERGLDAGRRHGHVRPGIVAGEAPSAVDPQDQEEGIVGVDDGQI